MRACVVLVAAALLAAAAAPTIMVEVAWAQAVQPPMGNLEQARGEVREVDLLARTIQVDGHAGLFPRKIVLGPDAVVVMPDGSRGSIASIREGDRVEATYRPAGEQNVAAEVRVLYSQEELVKPPAAGPGQPPQAQAPQPQAPQPQAPQVQAPQPPAPQPKGPMAAPVPRRAP